MCSGCLCAWVLSCEMKSGRYFQTYSLFPISFFLLLFCDFLTSTSFSSISLLPQIDSKKMNVAIAQSVWLSCCCCCCCCQYWNGWQPNAFFFFCVCRPFSHELCNFLLSLNVVRSFIWPHTWYREKKKSHQKSKCDTRTKKQQHRKKVNEAKNRKHTIFFWKKLGDTQRERKI